MDQEKSLLEAELEQASDADEHQRVRELASALLADKPDSWEALHRKAAAEVSLGLKRDFLATVDGALERRSERGHFLVVKAVGLTGLGDIEEAEKAAREAVEIDPENPPAQKVLAETCLARGKNDEALEAARKAVANAADDPLPYYKTLAQAGGINEDYETALEAASRVVEEDDADVQAQRMKATALTQLDRYEEALQPIERAYKLDPEDPDVLRVRAANFTLSGDYERGEKAFDEWLDLDDSQVEPWIGLGLTCSFRGEWERAIGALRRALDLKPDAPDVSTWLGMALLEVGETIEALTLFKKLSDSNPEEHEIWIGRAASERAMGFTDEAVASAQRALEVSDFTAPEAWLEIARCYRDAGRHQNSWQAFSRAAKLDQDSLEAALGVAVESIQCHSEARALNELREAESSIGPHALFEFNRGVALYKLGSERQALEAWRRALEHDPELGAAQVLIDGLGTFAGPGSWTDYWFGSGVSRWRRWGGIALLMALLAFLLIPFLEEGLIPGVETGDRSLDAFIPAMLLALLLLVPAIRNLAVGGVSLDVVPMGAPDQGPAIDPTQVLPVFTHDELDVTQLTRY